MSLNPLHFKVSVKMSDMSAKSVRWAYNFTKWTPSHSDISLATSCIQSEEKERLARFVFRKDLKSSLIGRLMMRKFVSETSDLMYNEVHFMRDDKGKPVLQCDTRNCVFNVSHQGNYTVFAGEKTETDLLLGVDVMKLEYSGGKSLNEFFRIMTRQFSPQEWITIKSAGDDEKQIGMFCRHWCLKESYVKAIGVGITINLQDIVFKINTKDLLIGDIVNDTEIYVKGVKLNWNFQETLLDKEHCVAVASNKSDCKVKFREIDFTELTKTAVPLICSDEIFVKNYFEKPERP